MLSDIPHLLLLLAVVASLATAAGEAMVVSDPAALGVNEAFGIVLANVNNSVPGAPNMTWPFYMAPYAAHYTAAGSLATFSLEPDFLLEVH